MEARIEARIIGVSGGQLAKSQAVPKPVPSEAEGDADAGDQRIDRDAVLVLGREVELQIAQSADDREVRAEAEVEADGDAVRVLLVHGDAQLAGQVLAFLVE